MKHLLIILRKEKRLCLAYIGLGIFLSFLDVYWARVYQRSLDALTDGSLNLWMVVWFGGVLLTTYVLNYIEEYPYTKLSQRLELDFKLLFLQKLQTVEYGFYQRQGTGLLTQRMDSGAKAGKAILFDFWFELIKGVVPSIVFSLWSIASIDLSVVAVIGGGYVFVFLFSNLLLKALYRVKEKILDNEELLNRRLVRALMEMTTFRVARMLKREQQSAEEEAREIEQGKTRMRMIHEAFFAVFAVLMGLVKVGILVYAWQSGSLSVGQVVALLTLVDKAYVPIAIFNVLFVQYKLDKSAYKRLSDFLDGPEEKGLQTGEQLASYNGALLFQNVGVSYGEKAALRDVNLRISPGETAAFVGFSGSGKTTAMRAAAGLLRPDEGAVLVDGKDLYSLNLNSYYGFIAYASQDAPVFDGSLRENLCLDREIPEESLWRALEDCCLDAFVRDLPEGLDTPIGEKGALLSGGERQRLALARVLLSEAKLVLLDEATSALDNLTEEKVMARALYRLRGRTVLLIAHRLESLRSVQNLYVFQDGRIVEHGDYEQLARQDGAFQKLLQAYEREKQ